MTASIIATADAFAALTKRRLSQADSGAIVLMGPVAVSASGESFNLTWKIATQRPSSWRRKMITVLFCRWGYSFQAGEIVSELT